MAGLISKIQYKTYEKGEYTDEMARSLEETIALIKKFPWEREQYAELGLIGPSVTIVDLNGSYLKAGIYYGGRFSLYCLDSQNRYYENRNITIDLVYAKVTEFFEGKMDLADFTRIKFQVGLKSYFLTSSLEYRVRFWKILLLSTGYIYIFLLLSILPVMLACNNPSGIVIIYSALLVGLFGWPLVYIFQKYYRKRYQYLKISRGNDLFLFGDGQGEVKVYDKNNILRIISYENSGSRSPNMFEVFEVVFKDGSKIKFSNGIISGSTLSSKFSNKWGLSLIKTEKNLIKILKLLP